MERNMQLLPPESLTDSELARNAEILVYSKEGLDKRYQSEIVKRFDRLVEELASVKTRM
jgi:hypothetical protein